jgi:hypothetical protein
MAAVTRRTRAVRVETPDLATHLFPLFRVQGDNPSMSITAVRAPAILGEE